MLFLYVYDVIVTGDDEEEITQLNVRLSKEFKIKGSSLTWVLFEPSLLDGG
jgi:hypothetical protein